MSVLADLYLAQDDEDALAYDETPQRFTDRAEYKSFTSLELSILWTIMRGIEWEVDLLDEFPNLAIVEDGERAISRLPQAMLVDLTELSEEEVASAASTWAATEELDCSPEDIRPVIDDLVHLARLAMDSGRNVYLWNCT